MSDTSSGDEGTFAQEARTQTAKAVILIVVAIIVAVLLLHRTAKSTSTSTSPTTVGHSASSVGPPTSITVPPTTVPAGSVKVVVLNGTNDTKGTIASQFSDKLHSSPGYDTLSPENATTPVTSSQVYAVTTQYQPEAAAIASQLGIPSSSVQSNIPGSAPITTAEKAEANVIVIIGPELAQTLPGGGSGGSTTTG